jgi:hypothetical protein
VCVLCARLRVRLVACACVCASRRQGLIVEIYSNNISLLQARACLPACVRACACGSVQRPRMVGRLWIRRLLCVRRLQRLSRESVELILQSIISHKREPRWAPR